MSYIVKQAPKGTSLNDVEEEIIVFIENAHNKKIKVSYLSPHARNPTYLSNAGDGWTSNKRKIDFQSVAEARAELDRVMTTGDSLEYDEESFSKYATKPTRKRKQSDAFNITGGL